MLQRDADVVSASMLCGAATTTTMLWCLLTAHALAPELGRQLGSFSGRGRGLAKSLPRPPPGALGPPAHFEPLEVGPYYLNAARTDAVSGETRTVQIQRLSRRPVCFHLHGLLSDAECDEIVQAADAKSMKPAITAGGDPRVGCDVAWLKLDESRVARALASDCAAWLLAPEAVNWADGSGFENLQVLRYGKGGEFKLHHDANERTPRMLTVLLYLNGVGETWFPLAVGTEDDEDYADGMPTTIANPASREAALKAAAALVPGEDGLLAQPAKGDGVAFFNFLDSEPGLTLDRLAMHAGLPAPDEKSVAALWFHLGSLRQP